MATNLGVHEIDTSSAKRAADYPGHTTTRIFLPGVQQAPVNLVDKIEKQCGSTWADGGIAAWSFKPHPEDVADGSWKRSVQDLAAFLKTNYKTKRTILVIWHEPENDSKYFPTPEHYVRMFNAVDKWMRDVWTGVKTCHAAMAYAYRDGKGGFTDDQARRWRTTAKVHGVDAYSGRSFPLTNILPEHSGFARWRRCVAGDSRWGVIERGWTCQPKDNPVRAATIKREFDWLAKEPLQPDTYIVWNSTGTENDAGLRLDATGRAALVKGFQGLAHA